MIFLSSDDAADETNDAGGHQEFTERVNAVLLRSE